MKVTQFNLMRVFPKLPKEYAYHIMRLCNGTRDPREEIKGVEKAAIAANRRFHECYNPPGDTNLILTAINALLGGYGVEAVPFEVNAIRQDDFIDYVNLGDTYTATILFNPKTNRFEIGDWGSVYENSPAYQSETEEAI